MAKVHKTCREQILAAAKSIIRSKEKNEFTIKEVIDYMKKENTVFEESTIRTHISSRCCINSSRHHAVTYDDFEKVRKGVYKIL
ncbi:hypothetical protein M4D56_01990 [Cytobacillus oceanisediminis]|uniref:DUF7669 domain-containing protein n=1 Tax=Cytobacillus oceanisediminis TaxID=665099 RepID=UPI00203FE779|nr:hypothetical protein [Cytobacillus oceanisediminis]MCM3527866.1 hypothetical protein [Cytobacillus oceanisediminis]